MDNLKEELNKLYIKHAHFGHGGIKESRCTSFDIQELEMLTKDTAALFESYVKASEPEMREFNEDMDDISIACASNFNAGVRAMKSNLLGGIKQ